MVFVNHSGFHSNSAHHIAGFARGLHARGHRVRVVADGCAEDSGLPPGVAVHLAQAFVPDGGLEPLLTDPATFIHAWTPREGVRYVTRRLARGRLRHVVHLEDHEEEITSAFLGRPWPELASLSEGELNGLVPANLSHPIRYRDFLRDAVGATVIVGTLGELVPPGTPFALLEPGIDPALFRPSLTADRREKLRRELGVGSGTTLVFHPGATHAANAADVASLYAAVRRLREEGRDLVLVRTGESVQDVASYPPGDVRDLGFVARERLIALLDLADICVQPGGPTRFNRYRFPSKLPEFFAMGRATITAATNVGIRLRDGRDAMLLRTGEVDELAAAIGALQDNPGLRHQLGNAARRFALRELRWTDKVRTLERFYARLAPQSASRVSPHLAQ